MPRKGHVPRREVLPDPVYNSELVSRFVNKIMLAGKKSLAQQIVYNAMESIGQKAGKDPLEVFETAVKNAMPMLEVRPRRVGGAPAPVPLAGRPARRQSLAIRWLVTYSRARSERTQEGRLASELLDAANNAGGAVKRKEEVHKMAEANKPFAHYRW